MPGLLAGKLSLNRNETDALTEQLRLYDLSPLPISVVIGEIFRDVELRPGFKEWTEDDALCGNCLERLVEAHLHLWLFGRRVKGGSHECLCRCGWRTGLKYI
jgi:hypothetical protein